MVFKITEAMLMESMENLKTMSYVKWAVGIIWEAWLEGALLLLSLVEENPPDWKEMLIIEANVCLQRKEGVCPV